MQGTIKDTPAKVKNLKLHSELMMTLKNHITRTQNEPCTGRQAVWRDPTQPRVSDRLRGKVNLLGHDTLVNISARAWFYGKTRVMEAAWNNTFKAKWAESS